MKKYIEAEEFKKRLSSATPHFAHRISNPAFKILAEMPAADVVEVVRCRDCKFATMTVDRKLAKRCSQWDEMGDLYIDADFFCACGQRLEK